MARSRNIKPGFFTNDKLAEGSPLARLLFAGLWTIADREGRLEYRPKKIKALVLPYDPCNVVKLIEELVDLKEFLLIYRTGDCEYIQILNFLKHQNPHIKESASVIPAPDENSASIVLEQNEHRSSRADSLNPITEPLKPIDGQKTAFDLFWEAYPRKVKKKKALEIWKRKKFDSAAKAFTADIADRLANHAPWKNGYIPHPTTYLNGELWNDEIEKEDLVQVKKGNGKHIVPSYKDEKALEVYGKKINKLPKPSESYFQYWQRLCVHAEQEGKAHEA